MHQSGRTLDSGVGHKNAATNESKLMFKQAVNTYLCLAHLTRWSQIPAKTDFRIGFNRGEIVHRVP